MANEIDTKPILNESTGINYNYSMSCEDKVDYLAQNVRLTLNNLRKLADLTNSKCLETKWTPFQKDKYTIEKDSLDGEGRAITELLMRLHSDKKGISFEQVNLSSLAEMFSQEDFELKRNLQNNTHSFALVEIDGKRFIIDCAYRQFFEKEDTQETLNLKDVMSCEETSRSLAEQILKYGWIEANPENLKTYLDGFIQVVARDKNVKLPTEQDYIDNIEGKTLSPTEKTIHKYEIKDLWKLYVKRWSPNISDEILDFMSQHREVFTKIKNNLVFSTDTFSIIDSDGKKYIRTNSEDFEFVPQSEDIEFTPENLKIYLDSILKRAGESEEIVTPSVQEYQSLYPCGNPVRKSYKYIIESQPYISDDVIENANFNEKMSIEEKLTSIVQKERRHLMRHCDLATDSLAGECEDSTLRVLMDSASKGFKNATCLFPGAYLDKGSAGHNCSIINLEGKSYIIDCTYRQFFEESICERCGKYMLNDETRKNVAEQILRNGWIEGNQENIKAYMDGFEMGKRKSFEETGISAEEYLKRLSEHETRPIQILTPRQIVEAGIGDRLTIEDIVNAKIVIENLGKRKERIVEKEL